MPTPPVTYAATRPWPFDHSGHPFRNESLKTSWQDSTQAFLRARETLDQIDINNDLIECLVVSGSLGRMEIQSHSDCDLALILTNRAQADSPEVRVEIDGIWKQLKAENFRLPKPWGIFASPVRRSQLIDLKSLGDLGESRAIFGKRIQILLDSQPLIGDVRFRALQRDILRWYATAFVTASIDSQWTYLINDLVRYYRSYAAWHQFKLTVEHDDSWYIRNAKLRTSRLIMFAGLLFQLGLGSRIQDDKVEWLTRRLLMTPLERVIDAFDVFEFEHRNEFIADYAVFFDVMGNENLREALVNSAPTRIQELPAPAIPGWMEIHAASGRLMRHLTEFTLDRRNDWHPRFIEYLLF